MLTSSFSIAEKEAKKLVQKNSSVEQFLNGPPAQMLTTRHALNGQHLRTRNTGRASNGEKRGAGACLSG